MKHLFILASVMLIVGCKRGADFEKALATCQQHIENDSYTVADSCMRAFFIQYELPVSTEKLSEGTFEGISTPDAEGFVHKATLIVKDGVLVSAFYDEIKGDKLKSADTAFYVQPDSIQKGFTAGEIFKFYEQELLVRKNIMDIYCIANTRKTLLRVRLAAALALDKAN